MQSAKQPPAARVFISYSHDSDDHAKAVRALSDRLRGEGVDCHLDQYETSPIEGWPKWMRGQIGEARFVLVICTETYLRRLEGRESKGIGLGAAWEGSIITQEMYENQGRNAKFVPVLMAPDAKEHIPVFLRPFTRYDVSDEKDYERLYRHLTAQPRVVRPELGSMRILPADSAGHADSPVADATAPGFRSLVLLVDEQNQGFFESTHIANHGGKLSLDIKPGSSENSAFLGKLQASRHAKVSVAFGTTGLLGQVESATQAIKGGEEIWSLSIRVDDKNSGRMEMAFNGISADRLAEMRARRILLDEKLPAGPTNDVNNRMLELFVRGHDAPIQVKESPLPGLYSKMGKSKDAFLPAARLFAVLCLRLSGAVERVSRLDMAWDQGDRIRVHFKGHRAKVYSNVDPTEIEVKGVCSLN